MHRIDNDTAVASMPTMDKIGSPGYFTSGNPATGSSATIVTDDWCNSIQEELMAFLEKSGQDQDKSRTNQVLTAAQMLFGIPTVLVQTQAAGNFVVPSGIYRIKMRIRAGGGGGGAGGGNSDSAVSAGGGGGAGAWCEVILSVQPGGIVSWVVGAGGSAGINNGTSGTSGGDTIVYVSGVEVCRVTGGSGGANATQGGVGAGGVGGASKITNVMGSTSENGAGGGYGIYAGVSQGWGGVGAASFGKSFVQVTGQNTVGISGQSGGGGSGGTGVGNGGAGVGGEVIYEY
ncbi:glycine-rich domain-containing protein [Gluconobacter cerinus]